MQFMCVANGWTRPVVTKVQLMDLRMPIDGMKLWAYIREFDPSKDKRGPVCRVQVHFLRPT